MNKPNLRSWTWFVATISLLLLCACGKVRSGAFAYVSNERDGTITVINIASDEVVSTIKMDARPRGIRISPDNKQVCVALSYWVNRQGEDKIACVDINSEKLAAKYDAGTDPEQFILSGDGKRLYVANEDVGRASVTDLTTNRIIASQLVGLEPEGVAISPDQRWVYVTSETSSTVSVIDTATNQVVKTFMVG